MDTSELAQRKLNVEIEKIEAEIAKLRAETEAVKPQSWRAAAEIIKVAGAVFLAVAASAAAVTTYRVTQLEARLAETEKSSAVDERNEAKKEAAEARRDASDANETSEAIFGKFMGLGELVDQLSKDIDKIDLDSNDLHSKRTAVRQLNEAVEKVVANVEKPRLVVVVSAEQPPHITTDIVSTLSGTPYHILVVDGGELAKPPGPWCELAYFNKEDEKEAFALIGKLASVQLPLRVAYVPQASPPHRFTLRIPSKLRRLHEM